MWHFKNKSIIHASAKHYSSFAKYGFRFTVRSTHKHRYSESEFHVNFSYLVLLYWHAHYVGSWLWSFDRAVHYIAVYTAELYAVGGCDSMDQVRDTNRQCHKVTENLQRACREAVQYIGMCHNAWKQQYSLQPCTLSLSFSCSVIPLCPHLSFCLSNSGSFFLSGLCPYLSLACLFSLSVSRPSSFSTFLNETQYIHVYAYMYVYVCVYMYMYVYIYELHQHPWDLRGEKNQSAKKFQAVVTC